MLNHQPPSADVAKLPALLQAAGYEVVAFGKVAHYGQAKDYGFDLVEHDGFHDDACIAAALAYLKTRNDPRPLCLCVGTNWPHVPWPAADGTGSTHATPLPPTHIDTPETRTWRARCDAAVAAYDADLGRVYDTAFERLGRNTLFLHASDHGAQWPFGKWNLYDAGIRVPFVAVWPDVVPAGRRTDAFVSLVDVLPTLIEAAGSEPPAGLDGRSFLGVLTGERHDHREAIFTTHSSDGKMNVYPMRSVRTRDWKYIRNLSPDATFTTHIDKGKPVDGSHYWSSWVERARSDPAAAAIIARYHRRPAEELYDLRRDPHEQLNLVDDPAQAETLDRLRDQVDEWMARQGDRGLPSEREATRRFQDMKAKQQRPPADR
jgi:arylsulfatase A-like enzyme